jgi:hypothetical protein
MQMNWLKKIVKTYTQTYTQDNTKRQFENILQQASQYELFEF